MAKLAKSELTLGVVGTSLKQSEYRMPLHPAHLNDIPEALRARMTFEVGYGRPFHLEDNELGAAGFASREALFETCDIVLLPKPIEADFPFFREGLVLWGWPHCVQGSPITQAAIDRRMTVLAWEVMNHWDEHGNYASHVFRGNNELAGYCAVLQAQQLSGFTGHYGRPRRAAVIGFGLVGVGAVRALQGLGYTDITVYLANPKGAATHPIPHGVHVRRFGRATPASSATVALEDHPDANHRGTGTPMGVELAAYDLTVNAVLQTPSAPYMFIAGDDLLRLRPGTLIVDVSCDAGMGFDFARPTGFSAPAFEVGRGVTYYAVDHTPSLLWESASWEISKALLPFLPFVMGGPSAWDKSETIRRAIEIRDGVIQNPAILAFQGRAAAYPHAVNLT